MQWLANLCVRRSVLASVLMLVIVVLGVAGYLKLGVDAFPKIDFPVVSIVTRLDGAAPEEVEIDISDKIEAAVNTISGIDQLFSISSEGVSQVLVTFRLERDVDEAAQDVRDHVATALPDLPRNAESPVIAKLDPDASPILTVALTGPGDLRSLTELGDKKVRRAIENITGVGQVTLIGGQKRQFNIWLDTDQLGAFQLTPPEVMQAVSRGNLSLPGGSLENRVTDSTVRVRGRVADAEALGQLILRSQGDHAVRLADVAQVEDGAEEPGTLASLNGEPMLLLSIRKASGENTVAVVEAVRERLDEVTRLLPAGSKLSVVRDASLSIRTQVDAVKEHLVLGAVFAALVVLVFLGNVRSTLIAALAIPISIVGTFALMAYMGFSLNIITLLALALAVGIVIDDAIVVLENIFRFIDEKKMKPFVAAQEACREIGLAVLATTLSLIAVFLPVAFMGGIVGRFLNSFGLTMAFAIGVSLVVSFSLTPMLAARWLLPSHDRPPGALQRGVDAFYRPIEAAYVKLLAACMARRWLVMVACALALASIAPLGRAVPKGFLPENDEANFQLDVRAPEGTSLEATSLICERLARQVRQLPGVAYTVVTIADNAQKLPNKATIYVRLVDPSERKHSQAQLQAETREKIVAGLPPGLQVDVSDVSAFSGGGSSKPVQWVLNGPDLEVLTELSETMLAAIKKIPGAADVTSSLVRGKREVQLVVDRDKAADLGVTVDDIAQSVQLMVGGLKISRLEQGGEDFDVRLRARADMRAEAAMLEAITVRSDRGRPVRLADVVTQNDVPGASQIDRLNRQRQVALTCNVAPGYGETTISEAIRGIFEDLHPPPGYALVSAGRSKETARAGGAFVGAFGMSLIFMYLVLAAQFESWLHPLTILSCLPLTLPFALMSLLLFGQGLNIQSALGLLVLFGVVKKNSILQVDHTNHLRREGMGRDEAILRGSRDRLRPILMTTIAFVAGMAPLATARGIGAGFNRATAGIVVGGQLFSLVLTLVATPVIYSLLDDVIAWRRRHRTPGPDRGEAELGLDRG